MMRREAQQRLLCLAIPIAAGALFPPLLVLLAQLEAGRGAIASLAGTLAAYSSRQLNLGLLSLIGLIPFVALSGSLRRLVDKHGAARTAIPGALGLAGALIVLVPVHWSFWRQFYRSGYMGFPHGLELLVAPFTAVLAMLLGLLAGWLILRFAK